MVVRGIFMAREVKIRQSNFELMRISSMIMIVLWHIIIHGHLIDNTNGGINLFLNLILCICIVHVNSFVLVTGYFQYDKDFSLRKFFKLFNMQWFYKAIIVLLLSFLGILSFSKVEILRELLPIGSFNNYWFMNCYLVLYLISPFLNKFIKYINQSDFRKCLLICFLLFSIIAYATNNATVNNGGSTIIQFVFLYLLGAYLHKYPIKDNFHFINYSKEKRQLIFLFGYIFFTFVNFLLLSFSMHLSSFDNQGLQTISNYIFNSRYGYSNPIVIIQTICYFLYFETITIKSKLVNVISSATLGIYLIHDNSYIRTIIYKFLNIDKGGIMTFNQCIVSMLFGTFVIFICCLLVEYLRIVIARFLNKRKFIITMQNKFYSYINRI